MADQKLSAMAVAVLTDAAEMYLNASGSRKATLENLRNFFLGAATREAVVAASTANGALATDFENGDVLDGVTLVTGDRILLKDQTAGAENGPYTVEATGTPTRATDFDVSAEAIRGATFTVIGGTANANTFWMHTTVGAVTLGSTSLVFTQVGGGGGGTFLSLTDVDPSTYSGQAAKAVIVNAGEDGLEFGVASGGGGGTGQPFKGALVKLAADELTADYSTPTAIPFDAEIYDVGEWHDNVTNNSRLTVPAGVTKIQAVATVNIGALLAADFAQFFMRKNGDSAIIGLPRLRTKPDDTANFMNVTSGVMEVVEGDYFEIFLSTESDASITIVSGNTFFSIKAIETTAPATTPRGALAHKVADETANYSTQTAIPWDKEVYDTDAIHDLVTLNTRMTVPAGASKVQLHGTVLVTGATSGEFANLYLTKNGVQTSVGLSGQTVEVTGTTFSLSITSPPLDVVGGDYFELELEIETDASITLDNDRSWFAMEIVEPAVVAGGAGKQTLWIPVAAMFPTVSNGAVAVVAVETVAGQPDQHVMAFATGADDHAQFEIGFPKAWDLGAVSFKAFWTHQGGQTGGLDGVAWGLQGVALSSGDPFATAYGTPVVVTDDQVTGDDIYMTAESAAITIAGTPAADDMTVFRIFRDVDDAADDLDIDAQLVGIQLFFTTDKATDD